MCAGLTVLGTRRNLLAQVLPVTVRRMFPGNGRPDRGESHVADDQTVPLAVCWDGNVVWAAGSPEAAGMVDDDGRTAYADDRLRPANVSTPLPNRPWARIFAVWVGRVLIPPTNRLLELF